MADARPEVQARASVPRNPATDRLAAVPLARADDADRPSLHVRLFGTHQFFRLWVAQVVSAFGDWLGFLGITILAARVGAGGAAGGGAAVGVVMAARIVPGFFLAPVAGVVVDRFNRKKVMVACDLGRAAVVATLPWVDTVLGLVIASFLLEIGTLLWSPAKEATVPNLVPPARLTSANSLSLAAAYGTFPIAALMFALLAKVAQWLGGIDALRFLDTDQEALAFYTDVVSFVTAAILIAALPIWSPRRVASRDGEGAAEADEEVEPKRTVDWAQTFHEMKEGWQYIFINPVVRSVNVGLTIGLIGGGMVVPLGSVFSISVLRAGPAGFGLFITSLGFGVAAGVLILSVFQNRVNRVRTFTIALMVAGGSMIGAASLSELGPVLALVFVLGTCAGAVYVTGFTLLHEHTDDELRGRTFSALYTLVRLCLLVAFAIGPFFSELLNGLSTSLFGDRRIELFGGEIFLPGVRLTLWVAGLIVLVAGMMTGVSLRAGHLGREAAQGTEATEATERTGASAAAEPTGSTEAD